MRVLSLVTLVLVVGCTKPEPQPAAPQPSATQPPVEPVASAPPPAAPSEAAACTADDQCVVASSYCVACACFALRQGASLPPCQGPEVKCLVDPCRNKAAKCLEGTCTIVDAP